MALTPESPDPRTPPTTWSWGVSPWAAPVLLVIALGLGTWSVVTLDPDDRIAAGGAALVFLAVAAAALRFRRRLTADTEGLVVRRLLSDRRVPWAEVLDISVPTLRRRGVISSALEIEFTDDTLALLRRTELGTDPVAVRTRLLELRGR